MIRYTSIPFFTQASNTFNPVLLIIHVRVQTNMVLEMSRFSQKSGSVPKYKDVLAVPIEPTLTERALLLIFDSLHSSGFSYLLNNGSIFSCFFRLLILLASATLKNWGATSTSHLGSTAVTLWQYSRVVKMSS